jgi:hypothetical protein
MKVMSRTVSDEAGSAIEIWGARLRPSGERAYDHRAAEQGTHDRQ